MQLDNININQTQNHPYLVSAATEKVDLVKWATSITNKQQEQQKV